jgi:hypothetical protein
MKKKPDLLLMMIVLFSAGVLLSGVAQSGLL